MGRPSGTVTFLFTDIEGSTLLWEKHPEAMRAALERHDALVSAAIAAHGGYVFSTGGDGFAAAFERAGDAMMAAAEGQRGLVAERWPDGVTIRARMGLHSGEASERDGDYFGPVVNRAARLMAAAHGGQVLCSSVTGSLIAGQLPPGDGLRDLGEHRLRDLSEAERLLQLVDPRLQDDFPPLRSLDSYPGNLPVQLTDFSGREKELAAVTKALDGARVVTLCGVGGVGKTRLALQVAAETVFVYPNGVWLVELAALSDPDSVDESIASALGVRPRPGAPVLKSVLDFIRDKQLLIVLDNCEHLLGSVARFVDAGVRESRGFRVLATSREGLAVPGECVITRPIAAAGRRGLDAGGIDADRVEHALRRSCPRVEFGLRRRVRSRGGHCGYLPEAGWNSAGDRAGGRTFEQHDPGGDHGAPQSALQASDPRAAHRIDAPADIAQHDRLVLRVAGKPGTAGVQETGGLRW